ncbi:arabinose efflux permease [Longilinea arvoryzae]|uniref:Arabinose efflux permease n=1 Tax=Longilinea arvoryzae TaxID=360412 RepID=A0A0S7BJT8_9CHLR|nr:MFS transporter [Longilinea arvoryzae]GAP14867.1 arabinose efflux permease [Longilinea arvoryzae]
MQSTQSNLKYNIVVNLLDGGFFGLAIGLASFTTFLPLFVATMTNSAILIGLVPAIHNMGWLLPQLFMSKNISRRPLVKPVLLAYIIHERLPFLGLAAVAFLVPIIGTPAALVLTFLFLIWQGIGAGLTANPWQNLIGKVIPADYLATFLGLQAALSNLLSSGGAILAGYLLEETPGTNGFGISFLLASLFMFSSWFFLGRNRESPSAHAIDANQEISLWQTIRVIFEQNRPFVWFLLARGLYCLGMMAFAYYIVYAVRELNLSELEAGVMTSVLLITQMVANILLGRLADKWSRKGVIELGAVASVASCLLAWWAPNTGWFYLVTVLEGIAIIAFWTISIPILLEFGPENQRPTYVGLGNTLVAPFALLSPFLGGWLADNVSYPMTFLVSAVLGLVAVLVLHFQVEVPRPFKEPFPVEIV